MNVAVWMSLFFSIRVDIECRPIAIVMGHCKQLTSYKGQTLFWLDNFISGPRSTYMKKWFRNLETGHRLA